jgi:hypothetical protein
MTWSTPHGQSRQEGKSHGDSPGPPVRNRVRQRVSAGLGPDRRRRTGHEYQTREDKAAGRPLRQKLDQVTGKRQWKATVTDPDEPNAKRTSFEITFIDDVQPVQSATEVLPGMRPVELEGLTAESGVAGNGEFKYQSYVYRATGFTVAPSAAGGRPSQSTKPPGSVGIGEQPGKAA